MSDPWNILDALVVILGIIVEVLEKLLVYFEYDLHFNIITPVRTLKLMRLEI